MRFAVGDRVELVDQTADNYAMRNGVVVRYRGRHREKEPRVRWASGWATSCPASDLRHMTSDELKQPLPELAAIDRI